MPGFDALSTLVIDPNSGMRGNLHAMLNLCGITNIDQAINASTAIRHLKAKIYDLVLCEYELGDGQDGQQLLEDMRYHKILLPSTIFIMVTAERAHQKVVSAAEFTPSAFILKPFTADSLLERVTRAVEKRLAFLPVYQLMAQSELRRALDACQAALSAKSRYSQEFLRIKAELHMALGEYGEAEAIYREVANAEAIAWAKLGHGKALFFQGRAEKAQEVLENLINENEYYLEAYDWLARTFEEQNRLSQSQKVLERAVQISPHAVRRLRKLGEVALEAGDIATSEKHLRSVVHKNRFSEFRDPEVHVKLVQTLVKKGNADQASAVIRDLNKTMNSVENAGVCSALSSVLVNELKGDIDLVNQSLDQAIVACEGAINLSNDLKLKLAQTCFRHEKEENASQLVLQVMNNASDEASIEKAKRALAEVGRSDLAENLLQISRQQVKDLISRGVSRVREGDYQGGMTLMIEALGKLPENPQVIFNTVISVLKYLENVVWEERWGNYVRNLIDRSRQLEPNNPRLTKISDLYVQIRHKYGFDVNGRER